ncbi:hypothetical protein H4R18_000340 [Coemansia javaensis]|uniref:Uncharacterized protein n=1 Tax=Coemansia javaensis TaxID=2761396 RepID=A0A9W8LN84_9FUNG|nr:hypothetical protein H4R18_000340 [Coemansia javaensis]
MLEYPQVHAFRQHAYAGNYTQAASGARALVKMAKKRRHDISIGLQSALSTAYAIELVYYFVRLRHLTNKRMAAWRATLMLVLLIVDIGLIWLTVCSKRRALASAFPPPVRRADFPRYPPPHRIIHPIPAPAPAPAPASAPAPVAHELPSYQVALSSIDPHAYGPPPHDGHSHGGYDHSGPSGHGAATDEHRTHLNTPITG